MLILDAGVMIGYFHAQDVHHDAALRFIRETIDEPRWLGPITEAEILVHAARTGREQQMTRALHALGVSSIRFPDDAPIRLAQLRARTGLKLPDCSVLLAAQQMDASIASLDESLLRAAERLDIPVAYLR